MKVINYIVITIVLVTCLSITAYAYDINDYKDSTTVSQSEEELSKEEAMEISKIALQKYFPGKFSFESAKVNVKLQYDPRLPHVDCYEVFYKFINGTEECNKYKHAYAYIDSKTGELKQAGILDKYKNRDISTISEEEGRGIAEKFIKENTLVKNFDEVEYLGEAKLNKNLKVYSFKYSNDEALNIGVSSCTKSVNYFKFTNEKDAKALITTFWYNSSL